MVVLRNSLGLRTHPEPEDAPLALPTPTGEQVTNDSDALSSELKSGKLAINLVQDVEALLPLPGIGQNRAEALLKNRPVGGYLDFDQLKALAGFDMANKAWAQIETAITFEVPAT